MLKRLYVDNYKCLMNFELSLGELTLLLGPNGSGKSSVLDVVFALREVLSGRRRVSDSEVFPERTLNRWQKSPVQVFEIEVLLDPSESFVYRLEVEHNPDTHRSRVPSERLSVGGRPLFEFMTGQVQLYSDDHDKGPSFSADWADPYLMRHPQGPDHPRLNRFLDFMRGIIVCRLNPAGISAACTRDDTALGRDGANFAAWYRGVVQERTALISDYIAALRDSIDGLKELRLEKVGQDARVLQVQLDEGGASYELSFEEVSDGQRALAVLYALVYLTAGHGISLFLDEPDNFVGLAEIQPWLFALKDACGGGLAQAVVCSHHPELIDYLGADAGVWMKREAGGPSQVASPTVFPDDPLKLSELVARGWLP